MGLDGRVEVVKNANLGGIAAGEQPGRAGLHTGVVIKAFRSHTPPRVSRFMLGVRASG